MDFNINITFEQFSTKGIEKGDFIVIGSNIPHYAQALTACTLIDIFTPCREDYK